MKAALILLLSFFSVLSSSPLLAITANAKQYPLKEWRFTVFLDDREIGFHHFTVEQKKDQQRVYSSARFNVKFLFVTAYSYEHNNVEQWKGQCLTKIESLTNDNGDQFSVNGELTNNGFKVNTGNEQTTHNSCIKTFAYWDPSFLQSPELLNSQTGKLENVNAEYIGQQPLEVKGEFVPAERYRLKAENLQIDLWYSKQDHWLALESLTEDGYRVRYQLQ